MAVDPDAPQQLACLKPYEPAECRQWGIYSSSPPRLNGRSRSQRRPLPPIIGQLGFGPAQKVDAGQWASREHRLGRRLHRDHTVRIRLDRLQGLGDRVAGPGR